MARFFTLISPLEAYREHMERAMEHIDSFEMREKGSGEWKSIGDVIRDGQVGAYRVTMPRRVKLSVRDAAPYHQKFVIKRLLHAH